MENLRIVASWLAVLGVPSIFTMIAGMIVAIRKSVRHIDILQRAQKAQMRSQLLEQYEKYAAQGYIEKIYLDEWMNQYPVLFVTLKGVEALSFEEAYKTLLVRLSELCKKNRYKNFIFLY